MPGRLAEDLFRRPRVNVLIPAECFYQDRVSRQMREDPQLDLGVVRRDQYITRVGNEGRANEAAKLRSNGNVLQVWVRAGDPTCRRPRLVKGSMHPAGLRMNQAWKGIHVSGL